MDNDAITGNTAMQQEIDYTAKIGEPAPAPRRGLHFHLTRGRLFGLAGGLVMTAAYFGTVVWFGSGLAEDVKAGTRQITAGMMVPDSEG